MQPFDRQYVSPASPSSFQEAPSGQTRYAALRFANSWKRLVLLLLLIGMFVVGCELGGSATPGKSQTSTGGGTPIPQFKTPANGVGFAVPSNRVKFIAPQLISSGRVTNSGRASLGVSVVSVDPFLAAQNQLPVDHGVLLVNVTPNGPAAQAGLRPGDIVVQMDGKAVNDVSTLGAVLLSKKPGETVSVQFYRGNQQQTVHVTLGELRIG